MKSKLGLVLSAGSAKGLAHIGVLKSLQKHNINIDVITGTSMGSLVGGLYAAGIPLDVIEGLALNMTQRTWVDIGVPRKGFIRGEKILHILRMLTKNCHIEETETPFGCIAANLNLGTSVSFCEGNLAEAIRASISIPGVFDPWELDDKILVDGALVDRLPTTLCVNLGAERVISVDVSTQITETSINSIFDVIVQSMNIMQSELLKAKHEESDILIRPDVGDISPNQFQKAEEAIKAGEEATEKFIPAIKNLYEEC